MQEYTDMLRESPSRVLPYMEEKFSELSKICPFNWVPSQVKRRWVVVLSVMCALLPNLSLVLMRCCSWTEGHTSSRTSGAGTRHTAAT